MKRSGNRAPSGAKLGLRTLADAVATTDGDAFDGVYRNWQLGVSFDAPDAMVFKPLNGMDLKGGMAEMPAAEIASVRALDH